jgi:hypothetical protein
MMAKRGTETLEAKLTRYELEDPIPRLDPHLAAGQSVIKVTAVLYVPGSDRGEHIGAFTFPMEEAPIAVHKLNDLLARAGGNGA